MKERTGDSSLYSRLLRVMVRAERRVTRVERVLDEAFALLGEEPPKRQEHLYLVKGNHE